MGESRALPLARRDFASIDHHLVSALVFADISQSPLDTGITRSLWKALKVQRSNPGGLTVKLFALPDLETAAAASLRYFMTAMRRPKALTPRGDFPNYRREGASGTCFRFSGVRRMVWRGHPRANHAIGDGVKLIALFCVAVSPPAQGKQDRFEAKAKFGRTVFDPGRNFGKYFAADKAVLFHFPQLLDRTFWVIPGTIPLSSDRRFGPAKMW
jgi:hypothetical protein